ncbi:MAG: manganese efflux pump MntP family protein [Candidatus Omnitrophota bacterium]
MDLLTIFLIAVGLSLDTFAVSIAAGAVMQYFNFSDALKMAFFFGVFQLVMPVVGWFSGLTLRNFISGVDHWIAFGLLFLVGCKMIYESFKIDKEKPGVNTMVLLGLALATSIDAMAVGLSLSFLRIAVALPAIIIGTVTFLLSFFGVFAGHKFGRLFPGKIEVAGGIVIIGIGIKILFVN